MGERLGSGEGEMRVGLKGEMIEGVEGRDDGGVVIKRGAGNEGRGL